MTKKHRLYALLALLLVPTGAAVLPACSDPMLGLPDVISPNKPFVSDIPPGPAINQSRYSATGFAKRIAKDKEDLGGATDKVKILEHMASCQYTLCQYDYTVATCDQMLKLAPANEDAFEYKSLSYLRQNQYERALEQLEALDKATGKINLVGLKKGIKNQKYDYEHRLSDQDKRWALACSAILFASNRQGLNTLTGCEPTKENIEGERRALREWWGISSREELLDTLRHITRGLHNARWQKLRQSLGEYQQPSYFSAQSYDANYLRKRQLVLRYGDEFSDRGIAAWDYGRFICLCRWGAKVGFFTEEEAWSLIMPVAARMQTIYSGWEQMAGEYLVGRDFWSHDHYEKDWDKNATNVMWLLKIPTSPWQQLAWKTDLHSKGDDKTIYAAIEKVSGASKTAAPVKPGLTLPSATDPRNAS